MSISRTSLECLLAFANSQIPETARRSSIARSRGVAPDGRSFATALGARTSRYLFLRPSRLHRLRISPHKTPQPNTNKHSSKGRPALGRHSVLGSRSRRTHSWTSSATSAGLPDLPILLHAYPSSWLVSFTQSVSLRSSAGMATAKGLTKRPRALGARDAHKRAFACAHTRRPR